MSGKELVPRLAQCMSGWRKEDPTTKNMLPVGIDVPEHLGTVGLSKHATALEKVVGDSSLTAFYYLLRIGEYSVKGSRNESKQTQQFKLGDGRFFKYDRKGRLRQLPLNATDAEIMKADGAVLKLDNQKNGWKGVCIYQEHNFDELLSPVRALGRRYCHVRTNSKSNMKTFLSAYWVDVIRSDLTSEDMSKGLKLAATFLEYPALKGIPVERVDTHSLRSGGANALSLSGYSDREIQKMGRWKEDTFKEYIREELHSFAEGMSKSMAHHFNFVHVAGGAYNELVDVTRPTMIRDYGNVAAGAA